MTEDLVIIGGGPAGLSAAIYAGREGFSTTVIAGLSAGGQLLLTTTVENYPGFPDGIYGADLITQMRKQAEKFGVKFIDKDATAVDFKQRPFKVYIGDTPYESEAVIVATGASAKWLGIESEKKFIGRGVSSCATCDAPFFKEKDVIVVGGGDTAMEDAIFLTRFARSVTVVHRRDTLRASKIMQERAFSNPKIKFIWNSVVEEIKGEAKVSGVRLKNVVTGEEKEMPIDGVFVAVGYSPNTEIFKGQLQMDERGYLITKDEVKTEIDGIYVAGDVGDSYYRQAITAAASGVKAALRAREYLSMLKERKQKSE